MSIRREQFSLTVLEHVHIPLTGWMREQAAESLTHATEAGEETPGPGWFRSNSDSVENTQGFGGEAGYLDSTASPTSNCSAADW
jgi:hypothetical protein